MGDESNVAMDTESNSNFYRSKRTKNELVLRIGSKQFENINIIVSNFDKSKKLPQKNPFEVREDMKYLINRHEQIFNMKYTRQGKVIFTTKDPICASQLLTMKEFADTKIISDVIWENITSRFLIFDIPVDTPLDVLANEIEKKNDMYIVEMRRFVKQNSSNKTSPILITVMGTTIPESVHMVMIHQKIQHFVDRPRYCNKCFSFSHPTRVCDKAEHCYLCSEIHKGPCKNVEKCINCEGPHNAKSKKCPAYLNEQKIMNLKCHNHITIGEARRIIQNSNPTYSEKIKTPSATIDIQDNLNKKFESFMQTINQVLDKQTELFSKMLKEATECIFQNVCKLMYQISQNTESNTSPARKRIVKQLNQAISDKMQWDAHTITTENSVPP